VAINYKKHWLNWSHKKKDRQVWCGEVRLGYAATYIHSFVDDDDDEIAYFTVRWKTRASFVYRTKNIR